MSKATDLLNSLSSEQIATYSARPESEPHIVIGEDRTISVPVELRKLGVQYDHNIETVTFDCPRYWDGHDLSAMQIYINYMTPDGFMGAYLCTEKVVEDDIFHFDWTISNNVTQAKGNISFLICAKVVDEEGNEIHHWNSELNSELHISQGMECVETVLVDYPDIVTQLLTRMDAVEAVISPEVDLTETETGYTMTVKDAKGTHTYDIRHGKQGEPGAKGDAFKYEDFTKEQLAGLKGPTGDAGVSIVSIKRTEGNGAPGTTDVYTITLSNDMTTTFSVYNGVDGKGSGDMTAAVYDTEGRKTDIFKYVDDKIGDIEPDNVIEIEGGATATLEGEFGEGPYEITFTDEDIDENEDIVINANIRGKEVIGEQLRVTSYTHRAEAAKKFAVLDGSGYIQHRTASEMLSDIGAAPAGYGLGGTNAVVNDRDWDSAINAGFYAADDNSPDGQWWHGIVENYFNAVFVQRAWKAYLIGGKVCTPAAERTGVATDGVITWEPWEYVNPPMQLGVEYRTTERYNGKPVYTAAFSVLIPDSYVGNGDTIYPTLSDGSTIVAVDLLDAMLLAVPYGTEQRRFLALTDEPAYAVTHHMTESAMVYATRGTTSAGGNVGLRYFFGSGITPHGQTLVGTVKYTKE